VMSWRGMQGGITATRAGHQVIMTPTSHCYFDYPQIRDHGFASNDYRKYLPLEIVYAFEPAPPELSPEQVSYILGAQGNVWTEHMETPEKVEEMVLPRMCALAEVVWSQKGQRNWQDFQTRLEPHYGRFEASGLNYHRQTS